MDEVLHDERGLEVDVLELLRSHVLALSKMTCGQNSFPFPASSALHLCDSFSAEAVGTRRLTEMNLDLPQN